jgi:hypothetical protein
MTPANPPPAVATICQKPSWVCVSTSDQKPLRNTESNDRKMPAPAGNDNALIIQRVCSLASRMAHTEPYPAIQWISPLASLAYGQWMIGLTTGSGILGDPLLPATLAQPYFSQLIQET